MKARIFSLTGLLALFLASISSGCGSDTTPRIYQGTTRTYYIAAEESLWDYAPADENEIKGAAWSEDEEVFVGNDAGHIGRQYMKALFIEYTDATFTTPKPVPPEWQHKGALGPILRAVVGDTIEVVFKNNGSLPYSIHPHGVFYSKANEGAGSNDGTSGADKDDDAVMPGDTYTYTWGVPASAGPGPDDGSSVVWLYHSHVNSIADTNTGLVGAIVVTDPLLADADARPIDVDREAVSYFTVYDENSSHFIEDNMLAYTDLTDVDAALEDEDFLESNLMHAINGYVYGNGPMAQAEKGEIVRWYLLALGTEVDLHTPHWHGNTVLYDGRRTDVVELLPASMKVVDMEAANPGTWLYHCHVNDHIAAGMITRYQVNP